MDGAHRTETACWFKYSCCSGVKKETPEAVGCCCCWHSTSLSWFYKNVTIGNIYEWRMSRKQTSWKISKENKVNFSHILGNRKWHSSMKQTVVPVQREIMVQVNYQDRKLHNPLQQVHHWCEHHSGHLCHTNKGTMYLPVEKQIIFNRHYHETMWLMINTYTVFIRL